MSFVSCEVCAQQYQAYTRSYCTSAVENIFRQRLLALDLLPQQCETHPKYLYCEICKRWQNNTFDLQLQYYKGYTCAFKELVF